MQSITRGSVDSWDDFEDNGTSNPSGSAEPQINPENDQIIDNSNDSGVVPEVEVRTQQPCSCSFNCLTFLRALWGTNYTEDTSNIQESIVKLTIREFVVYIFFLILLCIVCYGTTTVNKYYFTEAVSSTFLEERWNPYDDLSTFQHISNTEEWYQYTLGPLLKGLYSTSFSNANDSSFNEIFLIGCPRLRLLRVRNDSCQVHPDFSELVNTCYAMYSPSTEDTKPFGPMNASAWYYQSPDDVHSHRIYQGNIAIYNSGGYIQNLALDYETSQSQILYLKNNDWIGKRATRAIFIEFTQYNININLFCIVKLISEISATGSFMATSKIETIELIKYSSSFDYFILSCQILLCLYIIYYIVEEILEIKKHKLTYLKSLWSWLDMGIILLFLCCLSFNVARQLITSATLLPILTDEIKYVETDAVNFWNKMYQTSIAVLVFLAWIKLFKYFSFNRTMKQITQTLASCSFEIFCFSILFFLVFLAFAQLANLLFGSHIDNFSTISKSIYTQFCILLGDFDFNELLDANLVLGPAYFIVMVFVLFFILLSMFFAIISDAYGEVKVELSKRSKDFEMVDYFKKGYKMMVNKLVLRRNQKNTVSSNNTNNSSNLTRRQVYTIDINETNPTSRTATNHLANPIESSSDSSDSSSGQPPARPRSHVTAVSRQGRRNRANRTGVSEDDFTMLKRRVDRMEHSIGSVVSKMDAVLVKLEAMEEARRKRRDAVARIVDGIAQSEVIMEDGRQMYMERLVRDELEKWDSLSFMSGAGTSSEASHPTSILSTSSPSNPQQE